MHPWNRFSLPFFRAGRRARSQKGRTRRRPERLFLEELENRLNFSTYYWTALGDGQTWNDPMNWGHLVPNISMYQPGVPPAFSDVVFPPIATLPKGAATTINFNFNYLYQPLDSLTVSDSYTFEGTPVTIVNSLSVSTPFTPKTATTVLVLLSGLEFDSGAVVSAGTGTTLVLGSTSAPTGLQLTLEGSLTKTGAGAVVVNTQSIFYPTTALNSPVPVTIAGGAITLGENANLGAINFQINSSAALNIADDAAVKVRSITGTGLIDLEGTTTAGDTTSLSVGVPNSSTDVFDGFIQGTGQFIASGNGDLTTGTIAMNGTGSIEANYGTLTVDGSISAAHWTWASTGPLAASATGTFRARSSFSRGPRSRSRSMAPPRRQSTLSSSIVMRRAASTWAIARCPL